MFHVLMQPHQLEPAVMRGPVSSFEDAAEIAACGFNPLIIEWSSVHGWLSIWELCGNRWELVREVSAAELLRQRTERPDAEVAP